MGRWVNRQVRLIDRQIETDRQMNRRREKVRHREGERDCLIMVHLPVTAVITDITAASSIQPTNIDVIASLMSQCSREYGLILLSAICPQKKKKKSC